ncbi:MAG: chain length determinant protein, partial [Burkholderiales bacterium]
MSLFQFLRILWAHRWVTVATTVCTLLGALIAILIVPPRYQAVSRVMLNTLKPDPVTGEMIGGPAVRTYIATQTELIKDYEVAGKAVDQLNWASSPDVITQYQSSDSNGMEIRRWLAQRIIASTDVKVVSGTNILELSYRATSPGEAKAMADALRNAYIESTLDTRRRNATRTADWYEVQAGKERALLNAADAAKTAYEKEHGIVMQADSTDTDSARLRALSTQASAPTMIAPSAPMTSPTAAQLVQIDGAIAQAMKTLGPNHPQMVQLRAQRVAVQQIVNQELAAGRAAAGAAASAASANAAALQREVANQTSKVIAKRENIERLTQLQADVNVRREQYNKSMARIAERSR